MIKVMIVAPFYIREPKTITLCSLRPYQKDRFITVIQIVTKPITTPPFFIVPKGYGRDADCPSVPHTSDLSVKVLLNLGHGFSWVAQVNNDKVKAPEPELLLLLAAGGNSPPNTLSVGAVRKFSSSLKLAKLLALSSTSRGLRNPMMKQRWALVKTTVALAKASSR